MSDWYARNLRRIFFDMHLPDWTQPGQSGGQIHDLHGVATAFDPQQIVAEFVRAKINVAVVFAKCQYGNFYYNTRLGHKHTGLGDLDFLGEMIAEAHKRDIRVIGYYSNRWDVQVARAHPEWMQKNAQGELSYDRWPSLCLNSPYRDLAHEHLREMFTLYDLDGVWSDIVHGPPCFGDFCAERYQRDVGEDMPRSKTDSSWLRFLRWQQDYLHEYIESCRDVVRSVKPDAAFVLNFFGTPNVNMAAGLSARHLPLSDYGSTEGYTEWQGLLFPGYAARFMRLATLDRPFEVLTGRFIHTWDFTVRPLAQMRFEAFSVAANGGAVCVDDEPYHDGTIEPLVFEHLADIYGEIERREPYLLNAKPVYHTALYHSQAGRELDAVLNQTQPQDRAFFPKSDFNLSDSDHFPALMGAYKALIEAHIPAQFVDERPDSLATLARYRVVYLPDVLTLSDDEIRALRTFVEAGGGLVATGATSLYDSDGNQLGNFALADLFGVDFVERGRYTFPYIQFHDIQFHDDSLTAGLTGRPLPHYTALWRVRINAADARVAATRRDPLIETGGEVYYHNNQPPPGDDSGEPVLVYREVGRGRVVYCAALPESNYGRLGHAPYRRLIANSLNWAAGSVPPIQADGLLNTEIIPTQRGHDLIVHLVTGMPQRAARLRFERTADTIEEIAMLTNVRLRIPPETTTARRVPQDELLTIEREGDSAWLMLPVVRDWETIWLENAAGS
jgi:hypothetical protein